MKIKVIAAPLVVGAMMGPMALSAPAARAETPVVPAAALGAVQPGKALSAADAQKELNAVNARIAALKVAQGEARASFAPSDVIGTIGRLIKAAQQIKGALERIVKGGIAFLKSIPTRVELLLTMVDTINGAAHMLQDKVQPAHSRVFLELVHAGALLVSFDATSDQLKDEVGAVKKALADAERMPNLKPNDVATFYTKAKLVRVLHEIRFDRGTCVVRYKDGETIRLLNRAILKAVGVRLDPLVRVSDVDKAIKDVKAAYREALKAPNKPDAPASPAVCAPAA